MRSYFNINRCCFKYIDYPYYPVTLHGLLHTYICIQVNKLSPVHITGVHYAAREQLYFLLTTLNYLMIASWVRITVD